MKPAPKVKTVKVKPMKGMKKPKKPDYTIMPVPTPGKPPKKRKTMGMDY
jgi:hypothetical protein